MGRDARSVFDLRTSYPAGRYKRADISSYTVNQLHLRSPWVTALWSLLLPGFGHVLLCRLVKAWFLILWEVVVNTQANINLAIVYSFTGHFQQAIAILNPRWAMLYVPVYVFAFYDSYKSSVDINKRYLLADRFDEPLPPLLISPFEINFLDKRNPWVPATWSVFMPGIGQLLNYRLPAGLFTLVWWITISYKSYAYKSLVLLFTGHFGQAISVLDPKWLLFLPSVYAFSFYDSYVASVEYNKLFEKEQSRFLRETYQNARFKMPLKG